MSSVSPEPLDVVETGGRSWSAGARLTVAVVAVAVLVIGLVIHWSHRSASGHAQPPQPSVVRPSSSSPVRVLVPLSEGRATCGGRDRTHAQVGFQMVNNIEAVVSILDVRLRIGGASVRPTAVVPGRRGLPNPAGRLPFNIAAGRTQWVSVSFSISGRCSAARRMQVDVVYHATQQSGRVRLSPFPHGILGLYSDCRRRPA